MIAPALMDWFSNSMQLARELPSPALLAKLTVVIPCYGRQDFLLRQLVYWRGSGASVVIVDGSPQPLDDSQKALLTLTSDITYLYAPISMMERLRMAAQRIRTPYAILLGDDEFLLLDGLCSAIQRLETDGSLVACIAQSLAFYSNLGDGEVTYGTGYPHWHYSIAQDDVTDRLMAAMTDYTAATCYAVLRAETWRRSWGQLRNWSSPYVGEMQQGITTYILGKLTTIEPVYWMRSIENRPVTSKNFNRGVTFQDWWGAPKFDTEREQFLEILSEELAGAQSTTAAEARAVVTRAVETFLTHLSDSTQKIEQELNWMSAVRTRARRLVASSLKTFLPQRYRDQLKSTLFGLNKTATRGNFGTLTELKNLPAPIPFEMNDKLIVELAAMEKLIRSFNLARRANPP